MRPWSAGLSGLGCGDVGVMVLRVFLLCGFGLGVSNLSPTNTYTSFPTSTLLPFLFGGSPY